MSQRPDYGIDAPGVIRNLALIGTALLLLALFTPPIWHLGPVALNARISFTFPGVLCLVEAVLMVLYSKYGKFHHADKMIARVDWRGDEHVLDVGTGRGLLLVKAARKLTSGHAIGIDIWNTADLSGNALERTQHNLDLEGVAARCELRSEDASQMSFPDDSFDVVLSNLCLHNIYDKPKRLRACREIVRVLKPGGLAVISDYKLTAEYADEFRAAGLDVSRSGLEALTTFPPLRVIVARKSARAAASA